MVLFPHDFFHIAVQMLPQQVSIIFLFQKTGEKAVHVVEHILQRLIQLAGVDERSL